MKVRIIASAVLVPLLLILLLAAPTVVVAAVGAIVAALAVYELTHGTGFVKHLRLCLYSAAAAAWGVLWCGLGIGYAWLLLGLLIFWSLLFAEYMISKMKLPFEELGICMVAGVVLPLLFGALIRIICMENGRFYVLMPFVLSILSDTGAYFVGLTFGKHKLAPVISPKKTVEGLVGGVLGAVLGMLIYCAILQVFFKFQVNYLYVLIYGVIGAFTGVFGDLCFSAIKRQCGIKDYGKLIPGHGGVLDRIDSVMLIAPLVEVLLLIIPVAVK